MLCRCSQCKEAGFQVEGVIGGGQGDRLWGRIGGWKASQVMYPEVFERQV